MVGIEKRDGRSEDFVAEKVVVSAVKSGAPADVAREIAKKVEARITEGISTKEIKRMILEMLREKNPEWEKNWLIYDRAVKKRVD
ncbi:MAG: ATP cone domain-containing protein [Candidatus Hodarchaeota archaeon]